MIKFVLAFSLMSSVAFAQPAEYQLKVTPAEVETISKGLQTQPFGEVAPLMNKLRQQIVEQQPKPVDIPSTPAEKKPE